MLNLEIKTEDGWRGLQIAHDTSIEMEHRSWLWDEESAGGFSHSFEIDIDANRELFGNSAEIHGERVRSVLEGKKMRMSVMGVPFLFGVIRLDDEIHIEDGKVDIEFCSENQEFNDLIEDMKCTDVKVKDKICVGTVADRINLNYDYTYPGEEGHVSDSCELAASSFVTPAYIDNSGQTINSTNVSKPYPEAAYCNMRICIQHRKKNNDGSYEEAREYEVFEADRPDSGVCFYVLYFLDCLFLQLGISFDNSALRAMEDFCRLAFFTTKCEYDKDMLRHSTDRLFTTQLDNLSVKAINRYGSSLEIYYYIKNITYNTSGYKMLANSKNFPNEEVGTLIEALKNAFAIKLKFNMNKNSCKAVLMRDVLRDQTVVDIDALVLEEEKSEDSVDGYVLKYSGSDDDTMYNYDNSNTEVVYKSFQTVSSETPSFLDKKAYYDENTGNMYRIKVDDDAKSTAELHPSLFEVDGLQEVWVGNKDGNNVKTLEIGFSPVVENLVEYTGSQEQAGCLKWIVTESSNLNQKTNKGNYAIFIPVELDLDEYKFINLILPPTVNLLNGEAIEVQQTVRQRYGYSEDYLKNHNTYTVRPKTGMDGVLEGVEVYRAIKSYVESPFANYDARLALTIMRGPGNEAGVETFDSNYDGEGNTKYQVVSSNYNSCMDSIDHYGNAFDYNGTAEGGVDYSGRFSLKPSAKKRLDHNIGSVIDGFFTVRDKEAAEYWLKNILKGRSGASIWGPKMDVFNMQPVSASDLASKGWSVADGREFYALYPIYSDVMYNMFGGGYINAFTKEGYVFSKEEIEQFKQSGSIYLDYIAIQYSNNNDKKFIQDLIGLADVYYGLADEYTLTGLEDTPDSMYYPIEAAHANRGLLETFHMEQAYFLMNKKILTRKCQMELAELLRLLENWEHKVRIGDVVGYIYSIKYSLSMDKGLSDVEVVMWYL